MYRNNYLLYIFFCNFIQNFTYTEVYLINQNSKCMENLILIIIIWIIAGLHSVWFLIKRMTIYEDFNNSIDHLARIPLCFLVPIITHIVIAITYPKKKINV